MSPLDDIFALASLVFFGICVVAFFVYLIVGSILDRFRH